MKLTTKQLKQIIKDHVIEVLDHKNLNLDVESFMKKRIPTAENIAISIWEELILYIPKNFLYNIRLYENQRNFVDYRGG